MREILDFDALLAAVQKLAKYANQNGTKYPKVGGNGILIW